ncbi:MAG: hypothetical protein WC708_01090 [Lentisphaeria bacterium]|jgi:hypothetical protein
MALAKIDKRKKLSKGRIGCTFVNTIGLPVSLPIGTVITDITGNTFRVTAHHSEDGEFTPLLSLSGAKSPGENIEY